MTGSIFWMFVLLGVEIYLVNNTKEKLKDSKDKFSLDILIRYGLIIISISFMISILFNLIISSGEFKLSWVPDWLLIKTIEPSIWINYFGSLFGAFLGGIVTLVVMYQSIKTQRETTKDIVKRYDNQYEAEHKPCLRIRFPAKNQEGENVLTKNLISYVRINSEDVFNIFATNNIFEEDKVPEIMNDKYADIDKWLKNQKDLAPILRISIMLENITNTPVFSVAEVLENFEDESGIKLAREICDIRSSELCPQKVAFFDPNKRIKDLRKFYYPTEEERKTEGVVFKKNIFEKHLYEYEMKRTLCFKNINEQLYFQTIKILFRIDRSKIKNNLTYLYSSITEVSTPKKYTDSKVSVKYIPADPPGTEPNPPILLVPLE